MHETALEIILIRQQMQRHTVFLMNYSHGSTLFRAVWSYKQLLEIDMIELPIFLRIASVGPGNCIIIPVPGKQ